MVIRAWKILRGASVASSAMVMCGAGPAAKVGTVSRSKNRIQHSKRQGELVIVHAPARIHRTCMQVKLTNISARSDCSHARENPALDNSHMALAAFPGVRGL